MNTLKRPSKTKEKPVKVKPKKIVKGVVSYDCYYPEVNIVKTSYGFSRMFLIKEPDCHDRTEYEKIIADIPYIPENGNCQIVYSGLLKKVYMVCSVNTDSIEEAISAFEDIPHDVAPIETWMDVVSCFSKGERLNDVSQITKTNKKGKPISNTKALLSPFENDAVYDKKKKKVSQYDSRIVDYNNKHYRTVGLTNYPIYIMPSLMTEITKLSGNINTSLYLRKIDKNKCIKAIDKYKVKMSVPRLNEMKEILNEDYDLYNTCALISVSGDTKDEVNTLIDKVIETAKKYMVGINILDHQQPQSFQSMLPFGVNRIKFNKVLKKEQLLGLLPVSYMSHIANTICYGTEEETKNKIFYNRFETRESGFILGSDNKFVLNRINSEVKQICENVRAAEINILSTEPIEGVDMKCVNDGIWSYDPNVNREIMRMVVISICGTNGVLSRDKQAIVNELLRIEPFDRYLFMQKLFEESTNMYKALESVNFNECVLPQSDYGVNYYLCGDNSLRTYERTAIMMCMMAMRKINAVYVLSAHEIGNTKIFDYCKEKMPETIWTISSISDRPNTLKSLYISKYLSKDLKESHFIDISRHEVTDRVHLNSLLDFDKKQKGIISSTESGEGILIAEDCSYIYVF